MKTPAADIEQELVNVRKAYRLLHDYQRAALDAASYIGSNLNLHYEGGYPRFSNCAPRDGRGKLDSWAWDWLNMMFYEFHFRQQIAGDDWLNLSIWLFSDTGYFISDHFAPEKTDVTTFALVEKSSTRVGFLLYRNANGECYRPKDDREYLRRFLTFDGELPDLLRDGVVLGKCYDFSQLSDEESTEALIDELFQLGRSRGLPLHRVNKHV